MTESEERQKDREDRQDDRQDRREFREDFQRLFADVTMLREARAGQAIVNEKLEAKVDKLADSVDALTSTIDRSRGALWVISGVSGIVGAIGSLVAGNLFHK